MATRIIELLGVPWVSVLSMDSFYKVGISTVASAEKPGLDIYYSSLLVWEKLHFYGVTVVPGKALTIYPH